MNNKLIKQAIPPTETLDNLLKICTKWLNHYEDVECKVFKQFNTRTSNTIKARVYLLHSPEYLNVIPVRVILELSLNTEKLVICYTIDINWKPLLKAIQNNCPTTLSHVLFLVYNGCEYPPQSQTGRLLLEAAAAKLPPTIYILLRRIEKDGKFLPQS